MTDKKKNREARLAEELRRNLRRRKDQARTRTQAARQTAGDMAAGDTAEGRETAQASGQSSGGIGAEAPAVKTKQGTSED